MFTCNILFGEKIAWYKSDILVTIFVQFVFFVQKLYN